MNKNILIQTPKKFFDVATIFAVEADKLNYFDNIYVVSNNIKKCKMPDSCKTISLAEDYQFSTNIIKALDEIDEDIFLLCCEDHIIKEGNDLNKWDDAYRFVQNNTSVGYLRLTYHDKTLTKYKSIPFSILEKRYKYYISLQPGIWRKEYLLAALKDGEDAWRFEVSGSARCKMMKYMYSYSVNETIFHHTNFLKSGKYYRRQYVDYAIEHNIELVDRKVYYRKQPVDLKTYLEEKNNG